MWEKIKKFLIGFCAFATPFLTPFNFIFSVLKVDKLIVIYYVFAIILLLYGINELSGKREDRKQKYKSKAKKTVEFALQPEIQAKKMITLIQTIKKVVKVMIKFLKTYKGLIVSSLVFIITVIDTFTGIFGNVCVVNGVNILQVVGYGLSAVLAGLSYGIGSPQLKDAIDNLKKELKLNKAESLIPNNAIKYVKNLIKENEKEIELIEVKHAKDIKTLENKYSKVEKDFSISQQIGIVAPELQNAHNEYVSEKERLENEYKYSVGQVMQVNEQYKVKLNQLINSTNK